MAKKKEKKVIEAEVTEVVVEKKDKKTNETPKGLNNNITATLILGLIGIILLFLPEESNKLIGYIIGGSLLLAGAITIIKYMKDETTPSSLSLISGILYAILGLIIVIKPLSIMKLATIIFGIYLIVNGALKMHNGYIFKNDENNSWLSQFIAGAIIVVFGLVLIINPFSGLVITKIAGAFLLIVAIYDVISQYILNK